MILCVYKLIIFFFFCKVIVVLGGELPLNILEESGIVFEIYLN